MDTKDLEVKINNRGGVSYWKDGVMVGKRCSICGEDKKISDFNFLNKKKETYNSCCKECQCEKQREWVRNNPQKAKETWRKWRKNNPEKVKAQREKRKQNNPNYNWRRDNPEKAKEMDKEYRKNNREKISESGRRYYQNIKKKNMVKIIETLELINPIFEKLNIKPIGNVYKITNIKTERCYIGQTIFSLEMRYQNENVIKSWIKERKKKKTQKFLEELNEEDLIIEIIDVGICKYHLDKLEAYYIDKYDSYNNGYNNNAGRYNVNDGYEEFEKILKKYGLEFIDGKLIEKEKTSTER